MRIDLTKEEAEFLISQQLTDLDNITVYSKDNPGFYYTIHDLDENLKLRESAGRLELIILEENCNSESIKKLLKERKTEKVLECETIIDGDTRIYVTTGIGCFKQALVVGDDKARVIKFIDSKSVEEFLNSLKRKCEVD